MKHSRLNWLTLAVAPIALFFGLSLSAPSGTGGVTAPTAQERHEGFEDMRHADKLLREARAVLSGAPGEYGGHRDRAIKRVDEALHEVHEAIEHH